MASDQSLKNAPHVVIVGGGFGGLWAARALAGAPVRVTLIDRCNHHLFQPLLYQVATAGLSAPDISAPLRHILRGQRNVTVLMAEVTAINPSGRTVTINGSELIHFDYLLLAGGSTHSYFGNDQWEPHAPALKTLDDALGIRRKVLSAFEQAELSNDPAEQRALMTFAIVGGGPTGVELAGTLAEIAHHTLGPEFRRIDARETRVLLIEAGPRILATFPAELSHKAQAQLDRLGVTVLTGQPVTDIDAHGVVVGKQRIPARTVLWAAGVAASPLGKMLGVPVDRAGRVAVDPDLSVPGFPRIFVVGDMASIQSDGKPVPGLAPAAKQMGRQAAQSILARIEDRPAAPFEYRDYGNLATIGRRAAIVDLRGIRFSGFLAWLFWLAAHILFLIGFRNRAVVLFDWAIAYWTYQRNARIIVGAEQRQKLAAGGEGVDKE